MQKNPSNSRFYTGNGLLNFEIISKILTKVPMHTLYLMNMLSQFCTYLLQLKCGGVHSWNHHRSYAMNVPAMLERFRKYFKIARTTKVCVRRAMNEQETKGEKEKRGYIYFAIRWYLLSYKVYFETRPMLPWFSQIARLQTRVLSFIQVCRNCLLNHVDITGNQLSPSHTRSYDFVIVRLLVILSGKD